MRNRIERVDLNGPLEMFTGHEGHHDSLLLIFLWEERIRGRQEREEEKLGGREGKGVSKGKRKRDEEMKG